MPNFLNRKNNKYLGNVGTIIPVTATPTPTPSPTPTPTPTPTPSGSTHNNTTPASTTATVTNWSELSAAVQDRCNGINAGVDIVLRGPVGGSTVGAYDGPSSIMELNPSSITVATPFKIRCADFSDKPIFRGPASSGAPAAAVTGWLNLPGNCTLQGINILDRNSSASQYANSYIHSYYSVGNITIDRCYIQGAKGALGGFGSTGNTRFFRAAGISNIVITNNVFDGVACALYMDGGASDITFQNNSVLEWGEHAVKIGGSVNNLTSQNNLFQAPNPGYDGDPADPYNNHGNCYYFGGAPADSLTSITCINDFLSSLTENAYSAYMRLEPTTGTSFTASDFIKIQNAKIRGGLPTIIAWTYINGTGNEVSGISIRRINGSAEVPTIQSLFINSQLSYINNDGARTFTGTTPSPNTGNTNTGSSVQDLAATLLTETETWAAGGNPAGITMQTLSTLGL
jgi:hypothetical protein